MLTKAVVTATMIAATSRRKAEISAIFEDTRLKHTAANVKSGGNRQEAIDTLYVSPEGGGGDTY